MQSAVKSVNIKNGIAKMENAKIVITLTVLFSCAHVYCSNAKEADASENSVKIEITQKLAIRYTTMPGVDAKYHSLDIYTPKNASNLPVIMMIHGGGWRRGDKSNDFSGRNLAEIYCREGFIFVSINYRLIPAGKHPANVQDIAKAVAWVHDHIEEYGGSRARINIMGHSAGGHLAALMSTNEKWLAAEGKTLGVLKRAVILDSAAYDIPRYMK